MVIVTREYTKYVRAFDTKVNTLRPYTKDFSKRLSQLSHFREQNGKRQTFFEMYL